MAMVHDTPIPTQVTPGDAAPKPPHTTTVRPAWPPYAHRTVEAIPGRRRMFLVESSDPKQGPHTVDLEDLTCSCQYFVYVRSIFPRTDPLCVDTHMRYARAYEITGRGTVDDTLDALIAALPDTAPVVLVGGKTVASERAATPTEATNATPNVPAPISLHAAPERVTCPTCGKVAAILYHGQCGVCRLQEAM